jgi:CRP/FNR family transcriptional regulator, cyclic AMP receptor protein
MTRNHAMATDESPRPLGKSEILGRHEFFRGLSLGVLQQLASHARQQSYRAGQRIFSKGDEGLGLLAVITGIVKISVPGEDGREIVLNLIPPNEIFGEVALLDGKPRTADAVALTECQLLVLDRRDFIPLIGDVPAIAVQLLEIICGRLRRTTEQVEDMYFGNLQARLAKALLRLAEIQGVAHEPKPRVTITQKELGFSVGLSRESTNRYLRDWAQAGYVSLEKGTCILNRPDKIASFGHADSRN